MNETRLIVGRHNGQQYKIEYGRMCDVGAYDSKARRWFLTIDDEYIGDFGTLKEADAELENKTKE